MSNQSIKPHHIIHRLERAADYSVELATTGSQTGNEDYRQRSDVNTFRVLGSKRVKTWTSESEIHVIYLLPMIDNLTMCCNKQSENQSKAMETELPFSKRYKFASPFSPRFRVKRRSWLSAVIVQQTAQLKCHIQQHAAIAQMSMFTTREPPSLARTATDISEGMFTDLSEQ